MNYWLIDAVADIFISLTLTHKERINIHYPTPVVAEVKEEVPEDLLDEIMEERMIQVIGMITLENLSRQVYTDMAEKKIRAMQVGKQLNIQMRGKDEKSYPQNQSKQLEEIIRWTLQEELEQRRHHDNLLPSEKKNIGKVLKILFFSKL